MEGILLEDIKHIVAQNIIKFRKKGGLSLQQLSEITGVSKTMLNQIETGQSNPSITILWRISSGLKVPLSQLISTQNKEIEVIDKTTIQPMYNSEKNVITYPYFLYEIDQPFEIFQTELQPHSSLQSESHHQKSIIFLVVTRGDISLIIENEKYSLSKDQAIKFSSDLYHEYINETNETASFLSVLQYRT